MGYKNFLWLMLLALLWGPSFLFIKVAVGEIPPVTLVTGRLGLAAIILYVILRAQGGNLPKFGRVWKHFAVAGFFANALPFVLFSWSEQYIDSALASILNGTTPLFTILLAHFYIADEQITPIKALGTLLGFGGLVLLISPSLLGGVHLTTWGLLAAAMAAFCYGIAIVYTRKNLRGLPPLVAPTAQVTTATLFLLPITLLVEQPFRLSPPSWAALGSLLGLAVLGTAAAYTLYYFLLERTNATYVSMVTYLVPVIGVILGVMILNEQLTWTTYAGCALILLGVMIANGLLKNITQRRVGDATARP